VHDQSKVAEARNVKTSGIKAIPGTGYVISLQLIPIAAMNRIIVGDTSPLYCIIGRKRDNDSMAA
jgi:hypothetical protein